ncbi:hypothetical protein [Derxia gummosa]|uniref:Baseplate protein J-like domain-containing protein n=1 Tax=Derxia gummosa DSM 723 TaxID=1121388 RepID=A0A8B6X3L1_9BURK|nr:hypothetical protein [Derxia gummosa]
MTGWRPQGDGTDRARRAPPALGAGRVGLDESTLPERIARLAAFAASGEALATAARAMATAGNPGALPPASAARRTALFGADDALSLARLLALDVDAVMADFLRHADRPGARVPDEYFALLTAAVADWQDALALRADRPRLPDALHALLVALPRPAAAPEALPDGRGRIDAGVAAERRGALVALASALGRARELAAPAFEATLADPRHGPAPALLLAFQQLYDRVRAHLDRFAARHADFYYREVLKAEPRPAALDWTHVVCARTPRFDGEVRIARGLRFPAGKDAAGLPVEFAADHELLVTDARVAEVHMLRLDRDPLQAPAWQLGMVCRARVSTLASADAGGASGLPSARPWWPLFGGDAGEAGGAEAAPARIGFAITSPLLWLAEGQRDIRLDIELDDADATPTSELVARLLGEDAGTVDATASAAGVFGADGKDAGPDDGAAGRARPAPATDPVAEGRRFRATLGQLFARWLVDDRDWFGADGGEPTAEAELLSEAVRTRLRERARPFFAGADPEADDPPDLASPLALIRPGLPEREIVFDRCLRQAFRFQLASAEGWLPVEASLDPLDGRRAAGRAGFTARLHLGLAEPAVVACTPALHDGLATEHPVLRVVLDEGSNLFALSLFAGLRMPRLRIAVAVRGLRQITLANQYGALDPNRPFTPWGPLPVQGAWLVVGAPEIAVKPITALTLDFAWAGLPRGVGGFERHYAGYRPRPADADFRATTAVLHDGRWQAGREQALFTLDDAGRLRARQRIAIDAELLRDHFRPGPPVAAYDLGARNGFLRLDLSNPAQGFGHALYPRLLTEAVTEAARRKRRAVLPEPAYTPAIEGLALDYRAETTVDFDSGRGGDVRFFHLHPFGAREVLAQADGGRPLLLPDFDDEGNLYLGLDASELAGPLSLLFELREETAQAGATAPPPVRWSCLAGDRWVELEATRVLTDTTQGFLGSGIVRLDIPAAADREHRLMPTGRYWLRASAAGDQPHFRGFAGLYAVHAQALRLTRCPPPPGAAPIDGPLPAASLRRPVVPVPGLAAIEQIGASFGHAPAETREQLQTRLGERLRHRQRAVTAWDYERLVLDAFPEVEKVKCFVHTALDDDATRAASSAGVVERAGHVLVVVLPAARSLDDIASTGGPRLNNLALARIEGFLRRHASPTARLRVINASYEHLQVRCAIALRGTRSPGLALRNIELAIGRYLSPWHEGLGARFGWSISGHDIEAWLRSLDEVADVAGLSLLHFTERDVAGGNPSYRFDDSAGPGAAGGSLIIEARSPYSIAIPTARHLLTAFDAAGRPLPEASGVGRLEVGSTFIVDPS